MLAGYKIHLTELFYGYEKYWQEVPFSEFVKQVTDKDVTNMTKYSDQEYLVLLNTAYLQGPFAVAKILMPSELFSFLQQLRKVYEKHFNVKDIGAPDLLAEDVFDASLDFDNDSISKIMSLYGVNNRILGQTRDEFKFNMKNNLFSYWLSKDEYGKEVIYDLVRGRINLAKQRKECSKS